MAISKLVRSGIKDAEVKEDNLADGVATTAKFGPDSVESSEIGNGTVTADDLASTLDLSSKTVTLPSSTVNFDREHFNVSLLGFKMAVNENLTVFNLVDGVVDEFHDESGTDEAEGSNDLYNATDDYYINSTTPTGGNINNTAGFSVTAITEPGTSTAGTNPTYGSGSFGSYTVQPGVSTLNLHVFGSGGGGGCEQNKGGGGGYAYGTLAVTASQTLRIVVGEGGATQTQPSGNDSANTAGALGGGGKLVANSSYGGGVGGGLSGVFDGTVPATTTPANGTTMVDATAPQAIVVAGAGGGAGYGGRGGGGGGGLIGFRNDTDGEFSATTSGISGPPSGTYTAGGGGSQTTGGQSGNNPPNSSEPGGLFHGGSGDTNPGSSSGASGGAGYYGGGASASQGGGGAHSGSGGGGSSFHGHPQITSGGTCSAYISPAASTPSPRDQMNISAVEGPAEATIFAKCGSSIGPVLGPNMCASGGEGGKGKCASDPAEDGYVLINQSAPAAATSTTIVSTAFSATSVPTSSRIVVFEEHVDTPTLNTDIIASISRDGGSNFTTATLTDSGYVTGSSGQRILAGQATISGQPSGQSMRWKLALANNTVKIHGVSLSWA